MTRHNASIAHAMTHPALYFGGVFGALFAVTLGLVLVARATRWKPKPIKPVLAISLVIGALSAAGILCGIAGHDIHIFYWWLAGIPAFVVGAPICIAFATLFRWLLVVLLSLVFRIADKRRKKV